MIYGDRKPSHRASYREAVRWIAREDEPGYLDAADVERESGLTVALIADLWRKQPHHVAADVARYRRQLAYGAGESQSTRDDLG